MAKQTINVGNTFNDGLGEPIRTALIKINENFDELYISANSAPPIDSPEFQTRIDLDANNFSASWRDDGANNLGWYVGSADAADGSQSKILSADKATGSATFESHLISKGRIETTGATNAYFRAVSSGGVEAQFVAAANSAELRTTTNHPIVFYTNNTESARIDNNGDIKFSANVGIGETANSRLSIRTAGRADIKLTDSDSGRTGYFGVGGSYVYVGIDGFAAMAFQTNSNTRVIITSSGDLIPGSDNTTLLGQPSSRWSVVYAGTGTINTSDAREKTAVSALSEAEIRAAKRLGSEIGIYKWLTSVSDKGDAARKHVGLTVQRAIEIMEDEGLDPWSYGFICKDQITKKVKNTVKRKVQKTQEIEETYTEIEIISGVPTQVRKTRTIKVPVTKMVAVVDENGAPVMNGENQLTHPVPVLTYQMVEEEIEEPTGERLGFRPDQLDRFIIRGLVSRLEQLESK